jgi:O-antigen/teichoic acid export membrane protein
MLSSISKAFQEVVPLNFFKSKLLHQSSFYLLGQMLQKAVSFLLLPVWTIYLTPSEYGFMGILTAYSNIIHVLLMFGIYAAVTRHYFDFKNDHEAQCRYVSSNFLFLATVSGIVLAILALFGRPFWEWATASAIPFRPYVILMLISCYGGLLYRLPYSLFQAQQKVPKCITFDLGGFFLSTTLCLVMVVGWKMGIFGMLLGGCIAQVLIALIITGFLLKEWFVPRLEWRHISSTLAFGLPIVPHLLSGWALAFVDRVMLARMVPMAEVGRYTLGYTLGMVMLMIVSSINEAYQPYYYNLMTSSPNPQPKILRIVSYYLAGLGLIALIGSIFAGEFIALLTPVKFHGSALYVPPILLGYFMVGLYYFVSSPIFYHKKTHVLPIITGIAAVLNIALNYLLIPRFGAIAAAWNSLACYAVMLVIYYVIAQRQNSFPYPFWRAVLLLIFLLAAIFIAGSVSLFTPTAWIVKSVMVAVYSIFAQLLFIKPFRAIKTVTPGGPI